jgi:tRNA threonylcarbamoyladenosine biosynthesis protein TsaB
MDEAAISPDFLVSRIQERTVFLGDGLQVYGDRLKVRLGEFALFPPISHRGGRPAAVAELGRRRLLRGEHDEIADLAPRYLRPSEAELKRIVADPRSTPSAPPTPTYRAEGEGKQQ